MIYLIFDFKGATRFYFMYYSRVFSICLVPVYIKLHFLPILLVKLDFRLLCFCIFVF